MAFQVDHTIARITKNDREEVRLCSVRKGSDVYMDIRVWYREPGAPSTSEFLPGKGLRLHMEDIDTLIEGLQKFDALFQEGKL